MNFIWATRGRTWGFRFLRTGTATNPLQTFEAAFSAAAETPTVISEAAGSVAVRFPDPEGRQDRAGRVIPHEFVVLPPDMDRIRSVEDARAELWPEIAAVYATIWDTLTPPPPDTDVPLQSE